MTASDNGNFDLLVKMIKEVKPGLGDQEIMIDHSLVEDLGLDSLDLLQLSRRVRRDLGTDFDLEAWNEHADAHRRSVGSVLTVIGS